MKMHEQAQTSSACTNIYREGPGFICQHVPFRIIRLAPSDIVTFCLESIQHARSFVRCMLESHPPPASSCEICSFTIATVAAIVEMAFLFITFWSGEFLLMGAAGWSWNIRTCQYLNIWYHLHWAKQLPECALLNVLWYRKLIRLFFTWNPLPSKLSKLFKLIILSVYEKKGISDSGGLQQNNRNPFKVNLCYSHLQSHSFGPTSFSNWCLVPESLSCLLISMYPNSTVEVEHPKD